MNQIGNGILLALGFSGQNAVRHQNILSISTMERLSGPATGAQWLQQVRSGANLCLFACQFYIKFALDEISIFYECIFALSPPTDILVRSLLCE